MTTRRSPARGAALRLGALVLLTGAAVALAVVPHPSGRHARGTLVVVALVLALGVGSALVRVVLATLRRRPG